MTLFERIVDYLQRVSVRNRLILAIFSASLIVAVAMSAMMIYLGSRAIQDEAENGLTSVIEVLSQDFIKVLLLDSPDVAADTVSRLEAFPDVLAAYLYDQNEQFRFGYMKKGVEPVPVPSYQIMDIRYHPDYLEVLSPVRYSGKPYGAVYVRFSLLPYKARIQGYYKLIFLLAPMLVLLMLLVAVRFQRAFSEPVQRLAQAFERVSVTGDYTLRVGTREKNEIGQLFEGFNRMMERVQESSETLEETLKHFHVTLESIIDGVVACDEKGRVSYMNSSAEQLLQLRLEQAKGRSMIDIVNLVKEGDSKIRMPICQRALWEARAIPAEPGVTLINTSGEQIPVSVNAAPMWDRSGSVAGAVMVIRDVTEARRMAKELSFQAKHDSLTGLVNRTEFERIVSLEIARASVKEQTCVLLYLDLDQFKVVNDTSGHVAGDQLLRQLAVILAEELRNSDVLARLGGDEFGVFLVGCDSKVAYQIAENLRRAVTDFRFVWDSNTFVVGVSIGMVEVDEHNSSVMDLLSVADIACYAAKDGGRNRIEMYRHDDTDAQRRYSEVQWVSRIVRGLEENRFRLYRQRIVPLDAEAETGEHFEVLIRMRDEEGRLVPPGAFLPAAERYGVSPNIDRWVLRNVLTWLDEHPSERRSLSLCSINVSGHTLADEHFLDYVESQLDAHPLPADKLCFEITETAAISNLAVARRFISTLKARGCRFALDDFGSGLSSFAYLKNLDVDFLKIDGMFVRDMVDDPIDRAMVKSINEIGQVMGMKTIAEFVENDEILEQLNHIGVDYAQGYGIHKPEPMLPDADNKSGSQIA
ncbi:PAS domain S-box-containing protein/diguanylate cyclase (GGDEF)-like protein [Thiogranum longum]|uniref:PAS domain S-box-containing protein/diguanylate cyclase (GGDEF)-like protein n=1 Tax=Thiogranum longum TaxID=1537524 RepID=A0A4R1HFR9_9GAMM|nr:EAL domain-containing protein [Thiogranum longum]TCK19205.1 PAS domain S-box-containing protein/diguanylate cyclase (GGDEF)-like protein [Thiogranum longum]